MATGNGHDPMTAQMVAVLERIEGELKGLRVDLNGLRGDFNGLWDIVRLNWRMLTSN